MAKVVKKSATSKKGGSDIKSKLDKMEERKKTLAPQKNAEKVALPKRISGYFSEVRSEMKKVNWPGRPEVFSSTGVVLFTVLFFTVYIGGLDYIVGKIVSAVFTK